MKMLMRGVLIMFVAGLACSAQGGIITSGGFYFAVPSLLSATVSGDNFTATVRANDAGPYIIGFTPPFAAPPFNSDFSWSGQPSSGVLYNGVFYPVNDGICFHCAFSFVNFTENLISPKPIVTGPGTYSLDLFSVSLHFSLFDSSNTMFYSETDTGFATGSITYFTLFPNNPFVNSLGFDATIIPEPIPEPSTWSFMAFAACCLGAFAGIRLRRQAPGHRF
jgi:hypothetical protein